MEVAFPLLLLLTTFNSFSAVSIVKPTRCTNVSNLFYFGFNDTLHVSGGLSVHCQEFKTVHTTTGICQTDTAVCLLAGTRIGASSWFYCRNNITMHGPMNVRAAVHLKIDFFTVPYCYPRSRQNIARCMVHTVTCWSNNRNLILSSTLRYVWVWIGNVNEYFMCLLLLC